MGYYSNGDQLLMSQGSKKWPKGKENYQQVQSEHLRFALVWVQTVFPRQHHSPPLSSSGWTLSLKPDGVWLNIWNRFTAVCEQVSGPVALHVRTGIHALPVQTNSRFETLQSLSGLYSSSSADMNWTRTSIFLGAGFPQSLLCKCKLPVVHGIEVWFIADTIRGSTLTSWMNTEELQIKSWK